MRCCRRCRDESLGVGQVLANLTMLHRFFGVRDVDGAYWSLQIELIFYVWMLALWGLGGLRRIVPLCLAWTAASLVTRIAETQGSALPVEWSDALMLYWFPWFAIGILTYDGLDPPRAADPARLGALALAIFTAGYGEGLATALVAPATAALLHYAARQQLRPLQWPPLVFFGVISYPLYLLHQHIGWTIVQHLGDEHDRRTRARHRRRLPRQRRPRLGAAPLDRGSVAPATARLGAPLRALRLPRPHAPRTAPAKMRHAALLRVAQHGILVS